MTLFRKDKEYVMSKIVFLGDEDSCWLWFGPGSRTSPQLRREIYEVLEEPLDGKKLFHLCRTDACMNPKHYWAGDADGFARRTAKK